MPITQFNGKALVFNNGVVDVVQGSTSLVDSEKVAHIPDNLHDIDNRTIIVNAEDKLEVPIDKQTIYIDQDGFMKAKGAEVHDSKIILCTKVGDEPAGPVGSFTLNQNSDKTITIPIPQSGGGSVEVDNDTIINSEGVIEVNGAKYIVKKLTESGGTGELVLEGFTTSGRTISASGALDPQVWSAIWSFLESKMNETGVCDIEVTNDDGMESTVSRYYDIPYEIAGGGKG